jgi:hypothetical protein
LAFCVFFEKNEKNKEKEEREREKRRKAGKQQKACGKEFEISNNPPMCLPIK